MDWTKYYLEYSETDIYRRRASRAIAIIKEARSSRKPYLSFSGGKDSQSILCLMYLHNIRMPVFHRSDTLDFPDCAIFCKNECEELGFEYHEEMYDTVAELRQSDMMELFTVKTPQAAKKFARKHHLDCAIIGLRKQESKGRKYHLMKGSYNDGEFLNVFPIADFKGEDVMATILLADRKWFHVYDHYDPPHKGRLSWMVNPRVASHGQVHFLKRYYPEQFNKLCRINPRLRMYV
jgi:3'-phosphoadenosine 5'-phosphosulfate sulfotransferase (PAPS reductase)/FAD synthetase